MRMVFGEKKNYRKVEKDLEVIKSVLSVCGGVGSINRVIILNVTNLNKIWFKGQLLSSQN